MDPRGTAMKRYASHMLQFKNGADVSLLNAMMHVIVEEKLYDQQYIQAHSEGFDKLKEHLKKFKPEDMEKICGIAEEIRTVARKYATANAAIIFWGMGVSQHTHGTDNARCLISLALMCGQSGAPAPACIRCVARTTCRARPMPG
jgi:formate dehydrogenase major subunit